MSEVLNGQFTLACKEKLKGANLSLHAPFHSPRPYGFRMSSSVVCFPLYFTCKTRAKQNSPDFLLQMERFSVGLTFGQVEFTDLFLTMLDFIFLCDRTRLSMRQC